MRFILLGVISKVPVIFTIILGTLFVAIFFIFLLIFVIAYFRKVYQMRAEQEKLEVHLANEVNNARNEIQQVTLNNISQEIHDNVGQLLSLTKMQLNLIEQKLGEENSLIKEAKSNISSAMTDLRDLAKGMSSDRIRLLGLYDSVVQEAARISKAGNLQVQVFASGNKWEPEHQKQLVLFRVIQECFQNVIKHAKATKVEVHFTYTPHQFEISIIDNGIGFNYQPGINSADGMGLMNIFSRVQVVGGEVSLKSIEGNGCSVFISVPYNEVESQTR
jgi:two-component system, NarL family, sensor kinase